MTQLKLFLLGPFQATLDGEPIAGFRAYKVRALLAYLALEAGHAHPRPVLAGLLWPERPDRAALTNLRNALATLRHAIGDRTRSGDRLAPGDQDAAHTERGAPPYLQITRETIRFNPDSDHWLDVAAFQALVETTDANRPAHEQLEEAIALYRGDLLEGFSVRGSPEYEDWVLLQREQLQRQALSALRRLVTHYEERGELERACELAWRQVALAPWQEEAHRGLMRLLALSGQRGAALAQYEACRQALAEELGVAPGPETAALYARIRDGQVRPARGETQGVGQDLRAGQGARTVNLPAQLTPFVGREPLLAEIGARLRDPGCRLLTLVGLGGSGKTRLALEAAARQVGRYADGVYFCALAPLRSAEAIVPAIAQAIGFSFYGEEKPKEQLLRYLGTKKMLLVLDNYEHLLEGAALVPEMLRRAPAVVVLVTSRSGLQVQGEHRFAVAGMSYPALTSSRGDGWLSSPAGGRGVGGEGAMGYSAVRLFVESARRAQRGFALAEDNLADVVRICRLVEGMPLAILLAAAWVEMLTPAEIAAEIEGRVTGSGLDFLASDLRDAPERHSSVRAVFDHSWTLLGQRERAVMQALSVFRGGFTQAAAEAVAGASLRDLMALVKWSLLRRAPTTRYEMHELLRQYGAEKLAISGANQDEIRDRHAAYYAATLQGWAEDLKGPRQLAAIEEIRADVDNTRAAWDWAVEGDGEHVLGRLQVEWLDRALEGLCLFYEWESYNEEGEAACGRAADRLTGSAPRLPDGAASANRLRVLAHALTWQGRFSNMLGWGEAADQCYDRALDTVDRAERSDPAADVRYERAFVLQELSKKANQSTTVERARQLAERSLELYRALGDRWGMADAYLALGGALHTQDALEGSTGPLEESLSLYRALGDRRGMIWPLLWLNYTFDELGELGRAEGVAREAISIAHQVGDHRLAAWADHSLSGTLCYDGRFVEARVPLEGMLAFFRELGNHRAVAWGSHRLGIAAMHLGSYEEARAATEEALTLSQESGHRGVAALCHLGLGRLALGEGAYGAAQEWLQQSIAIYQELGKVGWLMSEVLAALAYMARGLGQPAQARAHLSAALRIATEAHVHFTALQSLPAVALLLVDGSGRSSSALERAVELYALASRYPFVANSRWFEDIAGGEIAAAASTLPPEVIAAAEERGRARDLWATVKELLVELPVDDAPVASQEE